MQPYSFSIIIPVFNSGPFLSECLDSILSQTFANWECICVDDGSTDESGSILDGYAAHDSRFRVVHQRNGGESSARNAALSMVAGTWFTFVDSDDAIVPDALECFHRALTESKADALLCFPEDHFLDISNYRNAPGGYKLLSSGESPVNMLCGHYSAHGYTVSKIYRTALFKTVRFPVGVSITPDMRFWADALCVPAKWAIIDKQYYAYRRHAGAASYKKDFRYYSECIGSYAYTFRSMSKLMGAKKTDLDRYNDNYRALHANMVYAAFRRWRNWSADERDALFNAVSEVCDAAVPVFPFGFATRIRIVGHRFGLDWISVPLSNLIDRAQISARYRMKKAPFLRRKIFSPKTSDETPAP